MRGRKDNNHNAVVAAFRTLGCSVIEMHAVGIPGMPDLAVGCIRKTHLVEIKNPESAYGRAGLNAYQTAFAGDWRGEPVMIVTSPDEAAAAVSNWRRGAA